MLHAIYEIRRNENRPDGEEVNKIEHALGMIHFLSKNYEKFDHFTNILMSKTEISDDVKKQLNKIVEFINRDKI